MIIKEQGRKNWCIFKNKLRLIAQGYTWIKGIKIEETFASVTRLECVELLSWV